ncbi:MAG TPA: amidohydrolase family protein, partial [Candidatus Dormibacteraeota bacterium]|nr:amidohydrolase family protein [Candidatus Dormibacteraeota bacterium]
LVSRLLPRPTRSEQRAGLLEGQRYLHSLGITAWQDAIVGEYATMPDSFETYLEADARGELTARVVGALWWRRDGGLAQLEELRARRAAVPSGRFRATSVKIMVDGVCENFTAALLRPYLDAQGRSTAECGLTFVDASTLPDAAAAIDAAGFQLHFHAIGDRAVRLALDAVERARARNGPNDHRPHIAHLQVVHPRDLPRFRALGVTANAQPLWAMADAQMTELTLPFLGPERSAWQYPFAGLHRSGASLAIGSDWPVSSPNPLWLLHVAVNRTTPGPMAREMGWAAAAEPFLPAERLDLSTALVAATRGSAYVNHLEGETGSIAVGRWADLALVDRNLFQEPPTDIAEARVVLTLVGGDPVHADPTAVSW